MANKDNAGVSQKQAENPLVLIKYEPANALPVLSSGAAAALKELRTAKITNLRELDSSSNILQRAQFQAEEIEQFKATLREKVQAAAARFREIPGFEDFEVTLTIRKWGLNQLLIDGIRTVKNARAKFLSDEAEKVRRANLEAQAKQDAINKKAADDAAAAAKKAGADKETVQQIKQEVLATPAPIIESKAAAIAENVGASVRYTYAAKITNLKSFLGFVLNNDVMYATMGVAIPDIEKAFKKMAMDQKAAFKYPGIESVMTPVDVARR